MDIIGLVTNLVSGAVGGNVAGAGLKDKSLGTLGNTLAGLVGGVAGDYILQAVGFLNSMGMADMSMGNILGQVGTGAVSGGVLTAIIAFAKSAMNKS
ncbi:MAG: hypothetical protein ACHP6H_05790 [Legionellales bacterium]